MARKRYDPKIRELAGDMYIHRNMSIKDISECLDIPEGTLGKWQSEDRWVADAKDEGESSFSQTCDNLMKTIHRMSQRLFQSTIPGNPDEDFILPDENLELRINRLTLAFERVLPMGNLLHTKHRVDTIREIKQHGFETVSQGIFTNDEMMITFKVLEHYLDSLSVKKTAS